MVSGLPCRLSFTPKISRRDSRGNPRIFDPEVWTFDANHQQGEPECGKLFINCKFLARRLNSDTAVRKGVPQIPIGSVKADTSVPEIGMQEICRCWR